MHRQLMRLALSVIALTSTLTDGFAQEQQAAETVTVAAARYLIGNSLTWDTVPGLLSGDVQWHVDCGVSLPHISAHPDKPCVKTSTIWPTALHNKQYDIISVQPHYRSTLSQDVETISAWMKLQPRAVFVIHSGWARQVDRAAEFASFSAPVEMVHSPSYVRALIAELRRLHPGRELRQTLAQNLLATIAEDIAAKQAPLKDVAELYRDPIHLTHEHGRYLMHNAMRHAMGQPPSSSGFDKTTPALKAYLDGVLALLRTTPADKELLIQLLSIDDSVDRPALITRVSSRELQHRLSHAVPVIERAVTERRRALALEQEINDIGGKVLFTPSGPQWLYLATGDHGMEIFDVPTTIDLYNGNNPLKGKGGKNEQVTDDWLQRLTTVTTLRRLDVSNCAIRGPGLEHVGKITGLQELNLTLTAVTDEGLKHLSDLSELRKLGLASTQCTGTGFVHLKSLRHLESVNFHFTPLNDEGLRAIAQVPISDRFWFAHTHFTDAGAASLSALTQLKRCGIGSQESTSSGAAVEALAQLPLEDLALLDNQATPEGVAHAAKIHTLRRLDISHAPTVTDESLPLLAGLPLLEELKLGSAQLTDDGLLSLAASKSLKKLTLSGIKNVSAAGIEALQQSRPELVVERR